MKSRFGAMMQGGGGSLFLHKSCTTGAGDGDFLSRQPVPDRHPRAQAPDDRGRHRDHAVSGPDRATVPVSAGGSNCTMPRATAALGAYMDRLTATHPGRVHCYFDDEKQVIDLQRVLSMQPLGTHLYVCGPKGMINWVLWPRRPRWAGPPMPCTMRNFWPPALANPLRWNSRPRARRSPSAPPNPCWRRWRRRASMRPICAGVGPAVSVRRTCCAARARSCTATIG